MPIPARPPYCRAPEALFFADHGQEKSVGFVIGNDGSVHLQQQALSPTDR